MIADLLDRLEHIAGEPVVPLAPDRVTRIESDLRSMYPRPRRSRRRPVIVRAAVAAAIAVVLGLVALNVRDPSVHRADLTLTSASKTVVVMPDGTRLPGRAGLALPDGATVIVEPGGAASIGDIVIAGGSTAIVDDGEVDVRRSRAGGSAPSPGETENSSPGPTPTTRVAPSPTTVGSATPPRPSPTTTPPATRPPTTPAPTTIAPRRTAAAAPAVPRLRANATRRGDRVVVRWQPFTDKGRASYAVVAAPEDGTPRYPPSAGSTVIARTRDETTVTIAARAGMRLRVVALSDDNHVLAASAVLTPVAGG